MDNNPELNGEDLETPAGSQPETITTGDSETVNPEGAEIHDPEEASWNSLSGPSKDRFKQMARSLNVERAQKEEALRLAAMAGGGRGNDTQTNMNPDLTPEARDAVRKLSEFGVATKEDVNKVLDEKLNQGLGALAYKMELDRLETKFDGSNGMPAFSKDEYENFVATNPKYRNYEPSDVYEKMFAEELLDYKVKNFGKSTVSKQSPTLRPVKTQVREEQWTPEAVEKRLQQPDGVQWYEKNKDLINAVVARTEE